MAGLANSVWAKSDGTTLEEHINDCLLIFDQVRKVLPELPDITGLDNFWELLFWALFFHDFGKIHTEFQKELRGQKNYWLHQRHEVYSVVFADKLDISESFKMLIKRAILAHHKTFDYLLKRKKMPEDLKTELELIWTNDTSYRQSFADNRRLFHPEDFVQNLRYRFSAETINRILSFAYPLYQKYFRNQARGDWKQITISDLKEPVSAIAKPIINRPLDPSRNEYWQNLLLWGGLKICDHYGSGKIKNIYRLEPKHFRFLDSLRQNLQKRGADFYKHQLKCGKIDGHCLLIAPTGSGKTESALNWLKRQLNEYNGRVFYVLPYTASINAMYLRLQNDFEKDATENLIGIIHGKLQQFLASFFENHSYSVDSQAEKNRKIKSLTELQRKMIYPLKVATPFQILKHFYGVKGFEMGITELAGSCLIFDEIHAYDPITFAQILTILQYISRHLKVRILIMTATLPTFLLNLLRKAMGRISTVKADGELLQNFTRHRVHLLNGTIFENAHLIKEKIKDGQRIIIVCNTVQNAQEIYRVIKGWDSIQTPHITLLHSRFNSFDRYEKELLAYDSKTQVLIGTQAIEVSLDIDYDVMFTEPAPLDALLQRFGRVNRKRKKGICDVYVCSQGGEFDFRIYPQPVVQRTLHVLSNAEILNESGLQAMLDFVYPDWEAEQKKEFEDTHTNFAQAIRNLQPFRDHKEEEAAFYEKFDGINVLPVRFLDQYKKFFESYDFISAQRLTVSLHRGMYFKLKNEGKIEKYTFAIEGTKGEITTEQILLANTRYDHELGLLTEDGKENNFEHQFL